MRRKPNINPQKCIRCGEKATKRLTPDMDCSGFLICDKCINDVKWDLLLLMYGAITEKQFYKRNKYYEKTIN